MICQEQGERYRCGRGVTRRFTDGQQIVGVCSYHASRYKTPGWAELLSQQGDSHEDNRVRALRKELALHARWRTHDSNPDCTRCRLVAYLAGADLGSRYDEPLVDA